MQTRHSHKRKSSEITESPVQDQILPRLQRPLLEASPNTKRDCTYHDINLLNAKIFLFFFILNWGAHQYC